MQISILINVYLNYSLSIFVELSFFYIFSPAHWILCSAGCGCWVAWPAGAGPGASQSKSSPTPSSTTSSILSPSSPSSSTLSLSLSSNLRQRHTRLGSQGWSGLQIRYLYLHCKTCRRCSLCNLKETQGRVMRLYLYVYVRA